MSEYNQTDSMITNRENGSRLMIAIASPLLAVSLLYLGGISFAAWFGLPHVLGSATGLALGAWVAIWIISRSYITNGAVAAFVTVDPLVTILGSGSPLVSYGPGFHFCYWWERRDGGNNVNLGEAAETFTVPVQVPTGKFTVKYSVRLRPDIRYLPEFLAGVASVAAELGGIISAEIINFMSLKKKTVTEAIASTAELNDHLKHTFVEKSTDDEVTKFEKRFGIMVGDVTVEEILPTDEVQKTMSAITEAEVIDKIVAKSFGYSNAKALNTAIKSGKVAAEEVNKRRTQTMAFSGNLQGMDLKEHTFRLEGLDKVDPAVAQAIATVLGGFAQHAKNVGRKNPQKQHGAKK